MRKWLRNRVALWFGLWIRHEDGFFWRPDPIVPDIKPEILDGMPAGSPRRLIVPAGAFLASVLLSTSLATATEPYGPNRPYRPRYDQRRRNPYERYLRRDMAPDLYYPIPPMQLRSYDRPLWYPGLTDPYVMERDRQPEKPPFSWYSHK